MRNTGLTVDAVTYEIMTEEARAYGQSRFIGGSRSKAVRVWARVVAELRDTDPETYSQLVDRALEDVARVEVHV